MKHRALFLDRDDTINKDPGYLGDPEKVELYPNVAEVFARLKKEYSFKLIVISNQSGVARGLITLDQVNQVNERINALLSEYNAKIDAFYYCPFHPEFNTKEECVCRKPSPYMVDKASEEHHINLSKSFFIGDKSSDVICAINSGVKSVLIDHNNTGMEIKSLKKAGKNPNFVACNFLEIEKYIKSVIAGGN